MANNYYTRFATNTNNTLSDVALADYLEEGIEVNSIAYSDILNGILRQTTTVVWAWADFVATQTGLDVGSEDDEFDADLIASALNTWVSTHGFAADNKMPFEKSTAISGDQPSKLKVWYGTQAQYDALVTKDNTTLYFIY